MTMEQARQTIVEDSADADPLSFDYRWHTAIHGFPECAAATASMGISSAATFRWWSHHCLEVNMGSGNGLMSSGTGSFPGPLSTSFHTPYCVIDLKEVSAIAI